MRSSDRAGQNDTSGGEIETELNELTVMPTGMPSAPRAPMTTTPVA